MIEERDEGNLQQIEYLLYQSTQGIHFMFENDEIARVLTQQPAEDDDFFSFSNMEKVQSLLSSFLERPTMQEKRSFLEALPAEEYELLIRAYFQLVENTILANTDIRH
jgi:hypothetical protein